MKKTNIFKHQYRRVATIERDISELEQELDELPNKILGSVRNSLVNQSQLDRMIEKDSRPIRRKIELLKQKRQFILDKIPLLEIFKG